MRPGIKFSGIIVIIVIALLLVVGLLPFVDRSATAANPVPLTQAPLSSEQANTIRHYIQQYLLSGLPVVLLPVPPLH